MSEAHPWPKKFRPIPFSYKVGKLYQSIHEQFLYSSLEAFEMNDDSAVRLGDVIMFVEEKLTPDGQSWLIFLIPNGTKIWWYGNCSVANNPQLYLKEVVSQ